MPFDLERARRAAGGAAADYEDLLLRRAVTGRAPYTDTELRLGVAAAEQNRPIIPRPEGSIFENTLEDLKALGAAIPKLPVLMLQEGRDVGEFFSRGEPIDLSNPANLANVPGVRLLPGSFILSQFSDEGEGVSGLVKHPLLTVLDAAPIARKLAAATPTVRAIQQAREAATRFSIEHPEISLTDRLGTKFPSTYTYTTPVPRPRPISDLIRFWRPGGPKFEPYRDPLSGLEPKQAFSPTGEFVPDPLQPVPNVIGRAFDRARQRLQSTRLGQLASRIGSESARWTQEVANRMLYEQYYQPLQDLRNLGVDELLSDDFIKELFQQPNRTRSTSEPNLDDVDEWIGRISPKKRLTGGPSTLAARAFLVARKVADQLTPEQSKLLWRLAEEAPDRTSFIVSVPDEIRPAAKALLDAQDLVLRAHLGSGNLKEVPFAGRTEIYPTSVADKIIRMRELRDQAKRLFDTLYAGQQHNLPLDPDAVFADIYRFPKKRQEQLRAAYVASAHQRGILTPKPSDLFYSTDDLSTLGQRIQDFGSHEELFNFYARDLGVDPKMFGLAHDTNPSEALATIRKLKKRKSLREIDFDNLREFYRRENFSRRILGRTGDVQKLWTDIQLKTDRLESSAVPARFVPHVKRFALERYLEWVPEDLRPRERELLAAGQIDRLYDKDRYLKVLKETSQMWRSFSIDPVWLHRVSDTAMRRMANPRVLTYEPVETTVRPRSLYEQFPAVEDLPVSVMHQAHELMIRRATKQFLREVIGRLGVTGTQAQQIVEEDAKKLARIKNIPLDEAYRREINRRFIPFDEASIIRGTRPEPLVSQASKQVLLPREIVENFMTREGAFSNAMIPAMSVFRTAVMPLSPRWLLNNIISNATMFAASAGPQGFRQLSRAWRAVKTGEFHRIPGTIGAPPEMKVAAMWGADINPYKLNLRQRLAVAHQFLAGRTLGRVFKQASDALANERVQKAAQLGSTVVEKSFNFNQFFDDLFRAAAYFEGAERGLRKGFTPAQAHAEGIALSREILQNWDRLTPIERNILRTVFPFYSWLSHISRYMLRYPVNHPVASAVLARFAEIEWEDRLSGIPETLRDLIWLGDPNGPGTIPTISPRSWNPFADVASIPAFIGFLVGAKGGSTEFLTANVNPFISTILRSVGVDPVSGPDLYPDLEYDPNTGGLRVSAPELPLVLASNFVPQLRSVFDLIGWNEDFRRLAIENPNAARRRLAASLGLPIYTRGVNVNQEQVKNEVRAWRKMMEDRSDALRRGEWEKLKRWPAFKAAIERNRDKIERLEKARDVAPSIGELLVSTPQTVFAAQ